MFRFIKVNKAKCLVCGDIVISDPDKAGTEMSCTCGKLKISGGATALLRNGIQGKDFEELSVLDFKNQCPAVNEKTQDPPPEQEQIINHLKKNIRNINE